MKLIFVGPQASGKGTQAKIIAEKLGLVHISTGDLLRNAEGDFKERVNSYVEEGKLVPDELILAILKERLSSEDISKGFILDGFPRNLNQAKELKKIVEIDKVIEISISDEEAIKRLGGRVNCPSCGSIFNILTNPPKEKDICDNCGERLMKRADDEEEAIKKRLEIYHLETEPILKEYPSFRINGAQTIEKVSQDILFELEKN
jgi:adenylate kinase